MTDATLRFGHAPEALSQWRRLVERTLGQVTTPFYLFSSQPLEQSLQELQDFARGVPVPVRHWLSFKTQPVQPLLQWWKARGLGVEVVSEFECRAALAEGFAREQILVNGPAKHRWLPSIGQRQLRVNIDSLGELPVLTELAVELEWSVGLRCHVRGETKTKHEVPAHFGMTGPEGSLAIAKLRRAGVNVDTVHFHCGTQITSPAVYIRALAEVAEWCSSVNFQPRYLDVGGGFPAPHVLSRRGQLYDKGFNLKQMAAGLTRALGQFPSVQQLWMENGRFVSARSGVLVVRVLDVKDRGDVRYLVCDGGRTMNALVSLWEQHHLFALPTRSAPPRMTAVCGPTCMGFDQLAYCELPGSVRAGDYLVWMDAGAYHVPWETRFSHGHAAVLWHENDAIKTVRPAQSFENWWAGAGAEKSEIRLPEIRIKSEA